MLSPSTAPRWKTATRTLPRAAAAAAVRMRNRGGPASATSEHAPHLRKVRRFIAYCLAPLELGRTQDQRGELGDVGVRRVAILRAQARDLRTRALARQDRARLGARLPGARPRRPPAPR